MLAYGVIFLGGIAGSLHCVGMCGGFPLALAGAARRPLLRQVLYNAGRLQALVFIGAVSGAAGATLVAMGPVRAVERVLAVVAGVVMIVVALEMLGLPTRLGRAGAALAGATVGRLLRGVLRSRSLAAPLALGVFNAFLPCQLVYAFAAQAASTASPLDGMLTMLAFGLGTVPAMLAVGIARALARPAVRLRLTRASACLVLLFGAVTIARGLDLLPHGGHGAPAADGVHGGDGADGAHAGRPHPAHVHGE
jgi:sulfite exporter TauE/SafE